MICPNCGIEIGGHVQIGSEAYQRVSQGRCPNCGVKSPNFKVDFVQAPQGSRRVSKDEYERNKVDYYREYDKTLRSAYWGSAGIFIFLLMVFVLPNYVTTSPQYGSKDAGAIVKTVLICLAFAWGYWAVVWVIRYLVRLSKLSDIPMRYGETIRASQMKDDTFAVVLGGISKVIFWIAVVISVILGLAVLL